jgi:hypothetical protein
MSQASSPRLEHLRRMTDSRGLIRAARGDCPDRFSGYSTIDNAEALRLCALLGSTVESEVAGSLASFYFDFLVRARRADGRAWHGCDALIRWHEHDDDLCVQSRVARALAAVMVSELPISMRLAAAQWWPDLLMHADAAWSPCAAANWLIAIGKLRRADPGRDLTRAEALARWLVEDCYNPTRCSGWDWFMSGWVPEGAVIPTGLWVAHELLGESRLAEVAHATTHFLIDHFFENDTLSPAGTLGNWSGSAVKASFDQLPVDARAMIELLCAAERASGSSVYHPLIETAGCWFDGANLKSRCMIDGSAGGCFDALTANGPSPNQGGAAITAYLLSLAALAARRTRPGPVCRDSSILNGSCNGL